MKWPFLFSKKNKNTGFAFPGPFWAREGWRFLTTPGWPGFSLPGRLPAFAEIRRAGAPALADRNLPFGRPQSAIWPTAICHLARTGYRGACEAFSIFLASHLANSSAPLAPIPESQANHSGIAICTIRPGPRVLYACKLALRAVGSGSGHPENPHLNTLKPLIANDLAPIEYNSYCTTPSGPDGADRLSFRLRRRTRRSTVWWYAHSLRFNVNGGDGFPGCLVPAEKSVPVT